MMEERLAECVGAGFLGSGRIESASKTPERTISARIAAFALALAAAMLVLCLGVGTAFGDQANGSDAGDSGASSFGAGLLNRYADASSLSTLSTTGSWSGHSYAAIPGAVSWDDANAWCLMRGGHLVSMTSFSEQVFVHGLIKGEQSPYWIGLERASGKWRWSTGEGLGYSNFADGAGEWAVKCGRGVMYPHAAVGTTVGHDDEFVTYAVSAGQWLWWKNLEGAALIGGFVCEWDVPSPGLAFASPVTFPPSAQRRSESLWADPVDLATGLQVIDLPYLDRNEGAPIPFSVGYDGVLAKGSMGPGWSHSYERSIFSCEGVLYYRERPSSTVEFLPVDGASGEYRTDAPGRGAWLLEADDDGYHLNCDNDETMDFDADGRLVGWSLRGGEAVALTYPADGGVRVEDLGTGAVLLLEANAEGLLERVALSFGGASSDVVSFAYSDAGLLTSVVDADGNAATYAYDEWGRMTSGTDADGIVYLANFYNSGGRIGAQRDANGCVTYFSYSEPDSQGNTTVVVTDRLGGEATHIFNERNWLVSRTDQDGNSASWTYDADGNVLSETDGNGHATTYAYDAHGRKTLQRDAAGNTATCAYDARGNLVRSTDAAGNATATEYDALDRVVRVIEPDGTVTEYGYDDGGARPASASRPSSRTVLPAGLAERVYSYEYSNGLKVREVGPLGNATAFSYDAKGRLASKTDPAGNSTSWFYSGAGNVVSETDGLGNTVSRTYDSRGNLVSETDASGGVTRWTYDGNGKCKSKTDAVGNITTYQYDAEGRLVKTVDAAGNSDSVVYSPAGRVLSRTDGCGSTTTYAYDAAGNLVRETAPGGGSTSYAYYANNLVKTKTDALGNATSYSYTPNGLVAGVTDPSDVTTSYAYDARGNLVREQTEDLPPTLCTYDPFGNLLSETDGNGHATTYVYDAADRLVSKTDPEGGVTRWSYDAAGNMVSATDALGNVTRYDNDALGRPVAVEDAKHYTFRQDLDARGNAKATWRVGNRDSYLDGSYDLLGRLTSESPAYGTGGTSSWSYGSDGLVAQAVNGRGQARTFSYDAAGRLAGYSDPEGSASFSYDEDGNLVSASDGTGTLLREYDALGRVVSATDASGNTTGYSYNSRGCLTSITYPDGRAVSYTYDYLCRMIAVRDWAGRTTRYSYDGAGNPVRTSRPDGSSLANRYDDANRLVESVDTAADGTVVERVRLSYDAAGHVTHESSLAGEVSMAYSYDTLGRLVRATGHIAGEAREESFLYDSDGNVVSVSGAERSFFDVRSRLLSFAGEPCSYDDDGNLVAAPLGRGTARMAYDSGGRLVSVSGEGGDASYSYDALDNRVSAVVDGSATIYAYDAASGSRNLLAATTRAGTDSYVYGVGLIGCERADGSYESYRYDARGSTVAVADAAGNVVGRVSYGVYGEVLSRDASVATPFLYNGLYGVVDDGCGLLYMRARYYAPGLMRFLSPDPVRGSLSDPKAFNPYAFAAGDPVSYADPLGRSAMLFSPGHAALDALGFAPVAGAFFDVANGVWYASEGDWANAGLSAASAIPGIGDAAGVAKVGSKAVGAIAKGGKAGEKTAKEVDDLLAGLTLGRKTSGKSVQYESSGGFEQAVKDFDSLPLSNVRRYDKGTVVGELPDGRTVNVRIESSSGLPTLEIYNPSNNRRIKIRYE